MLIKASGYRLSDIKDGEGLVFVRHNEVKQFYQNKNGDSLADIEIVSKSLVSDCTEPITTAKPDLCASIEAGFHSLLGKYVIHTHSVYANIINCSDEGLKLLGEIFTDSKYPIIQFAYFSPGFNLTQAIQKSLEKFSNDNGFIPKIFFLKNYINMC